LYLAGNYADAIKYYNAAIKKDVRNPKYYSAVADCYKQLGQIEKAMLYYDYADKLGGVPQEDYNDKKEKEALGRSNLLANNVSILTAGIFNIYYERRFLDRLSLGVDVGYFWSMSLMSLASGGGSNISGVGYMVGSKLNWFFEGKALTGLFAGPEFYYYGINVSSKSQDIYGRTTESKINFGVFTTGAHFGYRMIFDGGLSIDAILALIYISSASINLGGSTNTLKFAIILPSLGTNVGYAF
jgi:tetratricopeptide (TPR) repeat protein